MDVEVKLDFIEKSKLE